MADARAASRDARALPDPDQSLGVCQASGEDLLVLDVIGPDFDLVGVELREAQEVAKGVVPVVEDRNPHDQVASRSSPASVNRTRSRSR